MKCEKVGRISNGKFIENFNANKPGRRCVASNKDGDWLVYIDTIIFTKNKKCRSMFSDCFLWNPSLQIQVQLPRLSDQSKDFFKCLVTCHVDTTTAFCCYKAYFFYKNRASYISCTQDSHNWKNEDYTTDPGHGIFSDVALYNHHSESKKNVVETFCGITTGGTLLVHRLTTVALPLGLCGNRWRRLVVCDGKDGRENNRLLLLERMPPWEVWEFDSSRRTWVRLSSLEGLVVFLGRKNSAACEHRPDSGLVGNCICFTEDGDDDNFYVFSLADQTVSIFRNQPRSGFPAWFPNMTEEDLTMPWLSFIEEDVQKNAISEGLDEEKEYEIRPLDPEECYIAQLPYDLQRIIAESLRSSARDYANYRLVCRTWREIARPMRWKSHLSNPPSTEYPWLMSFAEIDSCTSFIDPSYNMMYFNSNPELSGCKVSDSRNGWLLVTRGLTVFFFEPLSKTKISLPDLPAGTKVEFMSFSSSPTSSDWIIMAVLPTLMSKFALRYLRSADKEWNRRGYESPEILTLRNPGCNLVFHDNRFFYLCQNGRLAFYEPGALILRVSNLDSSFQSLSDHRKGHLVSCERDLYLVATGPLGKFVNLYKMDAATSRWKEVKILPTGFSFFISQTSSFAVRVTEKARQNTINLPLFVQNRHAHVCYKLDTSEFTCYGDDNSSVGLHERKELLEWTWFQPKVTRKYS